MPVSLHPAQILLDRRERRRSFLSWCNFLESKRDQEPADHHKLIIKTLQDVTEGKLKNVILLMPPGAAKSTYTSVNFVPWYLAQHPTHLFLACSYSYSLVEGFGRQCRDLIDLHKNELGYTLSKTAAASGDWRIDKGGGYFCAGVGSGIAGHRADVALIDDYLGSQEDADSETMREKQWQWYWNDLWPRLKPNAALVIIANRRHEDDLVGRLLAKEEKQWTIIRLPYFAEADDLLGRPCGIKWDPQTEKTIYDVNSRLWPTWFDEAHACKVMQLDARVLAGLYQQRPTPEEGSFFKRHMLVGYSLDDLQNAEKAGLRFYVGADYAVRKGQQNDRTCFIVAGVDSINRIWIMPDWYWTKCDTLESVEQMFKIADRRKPMAWYCGRENITGVLEPFINKFSQERGKFIPIEELSESHDKQAKAQAIKARMSQKMVMFPKYAPSWNEAESELLSFPGGAHDDFVDALAKIGQGLDRMVKPNTPPPAEKSLTDYHWKATLGSIKQSHDRFIRSQRAMELDK